MTLHEAHSGPCGREYEIPAGVLGPDPVRVACVGYVPIDWDDNT